MSGQSDNAFVLKGLTHGAVDYMLKPLQFEELRFIWQHALRSRHVAAAAAAKASDSEKASNSDEHAKADAPASTSPPAAGKESERPQRKLDARKRKEAAEDRDDDIDTARQSAPRRLPLHAHAQPLASRRPLAPIASLTPPPPRLSGPPQEDDMTALGAKKPRVVWSVDLHQQFVNAVNALGVDKAVPKRILDLMSVEACARPPRGSSSVVAPTLRRAPGLALCLCPPHRRRLSWHAGSHPRERGVSPPEVPPVPEAGPGAPSFASLLRPLAE